MKTLIILIALMYIPVAEIVEKVRIPQPKYVTVFTKRKR